MWKLMKTRARVPTFISPWQRNFPFQRWCGSWSSEPRWMATASVWNIAASQHKPDSIMCTWYMYYHYLHGMVCIVIISHWHRLCVCVWHIAAKHSLCRRLHEKNIYKFQQTTHSWSISQAQSKGKGFCRGPSLLSRSIACSSRVTWDLGKHDSRGSCYSRPGFTSLRCSIHMIIYYNIHII